MKKLLKSIMRQLPDKLYLQIKYLYMFKSMLNLKQPKTFNEKLQWLKLNYRKPYLTVCADKAAVKDYVSDIIGENHIIPTLGVYESFDEIKFEDLPEQFVLKTTHDSGGVIICEDKLTFNKEAAKEKLEKSLKTDFFQYGREWAYKDVPRRIIAEKYMVDESGTELKDYKFFCFNGVPRLIQLDYNRFVNHCRNLYDLEWNLLEIRYGYPTDANQSFEKPAFLDEMLALASQLSAGIPFVRVDFYMTEKEIFFGEMTFYPEAGFCQFQPQSFDLELGEYLSLEEQGNE